MKGTLELLRLLGPTIHDICTWSGTPGLSLGVIHHGSAVFRENYGYRDIEAQLKPGSKAGYTTSLILLPDTQNAIAVLANSMALNDVVDWVSQVVLETLLNTSEPADYIALSRASANAQIAKFPGMKERLKKNRTYGTDPGALTRYEGKYFNSIEDIFVEIYLEDGNLRLAFQGLREQQSWPLNHYRFATFSWLMERNECVKRAGSLLPLKVCTFRVCGRGGCNCCTPLGWTRSTSCILAADQVRRTVALRSL
ncbi:hypothetical protein BJX76DRAFT_357674 [Aspergillus varians]